MSRDLPPWVSYVGLAVSALGLVLKLSERQTRDPVPWGALTRSETAREQGLPNEPGPTARNALETLYRRVLVPVSLTVGTYRVTSGYRSPALNKAIGGAPGSQHVKGEAADLAFDGLTAIEAAKRLHDAGIEVDQVIVYAQRGHLHVSFTTRRKNRNQYLIDHERGGPLASIPWAGGTHAGA